MAKGPFDTLAATLWPPAFERLLAASASEKRVATVVTGLALILSYIALDGLTIIRPLYGLSITPLKPAPALAFAMIYYVGPALAPYALFAPILSWLVFRPPLLPWDAALVVGPLLIAPHIAAAEILRRTSGFDPRLNSVKDVLILLSVLSLAAIGSTVAVFAGFAAFELADGAMLFGCARRALVGMLTGSMVTVPLFLMVTCGKLQVAWRREIVAQVGCTLLVLGIVFGYEHATAFQLFYLLFLPMLWITLRHGITGAAVMLPLVQAGLIVGAEIRFGNAPGLLIIQVLMVTLAVTALLVGAVVTEREVVARRLQDQQAALFRAMRVRSAGETAVAIAHELNQPLAALASYCELTRQAVARNDRDLALKASERLSALCARANEVLKSTRSLLAHERSSWSKQSLAKVAADVVSILRPEAEKQSVRLRLEPDNHLPVMAVDRVQIEQAIYNVIANAIEAISGEHRAGVITVNVRQHERNVVVEVSDTGPGFPPGLASTAMSTFVTTKPGGSGLGLAIARSVAEAHGGSLSIANGPRGAVVSLHFPMMDENHG